MFPKVKNNIQSMFSKKHLSEEDYKYLYVYSVYPDSDIRIDVAQLLCDRYSVRAEKVLLRMTYDIDETVKLNVVDSLSMGKRKRTLKRLSRLTKSKNDLLRAYAHMSYCNVIVNRNIKMEKRNYIKWVMESLLKEESDIVKLMLESELYIHGMKSYFKNIEKIIRQEMLIGFTENIWLILNILEEIYDENNYQRIQKLLYLIEEKANLKQKERIKELKKRGEYVEEK